MFSISTLRNGSGSEGWCVFSFAGEAGFEGVVKVTSGWASTISTSSSVPLMRFRAVSSTWDRISGGHRFQSSSSASPPIIRHSTAVMDRTVAVLPSDKPRLATSPKYCPCFRRGRENVFSDSCTTSASPRTMKKMSLPGLP